MRILLTGVAGFIGSHLAERLIEEGEEVVGLDAFDDFYDPALKRRNVRGLLARSAFHLVEGDVRDRQLLDEVLVHYEPEAVVHLAARPGVRPSLERPALYVDVNVVGTVTLLDACLARGLRRLVIASSSSVYGGRRDVPFRETDRVDRPESPYAATKLSCEVVAHAYHRAFGLDIGCLRYFTAYGPRQRPDMAFRRWADQLRAGEAVVLHRAEGGRAGDRPEVMRDFTYVGDVVDGTIRAMRRISGFEVLNIGTGEAIVLGDALRILAEALGCEPRIEERDLPTGEVPVTFADCDRARTLLGYVPRVDLQTGIERFVTWLDEEAGGG